MYSQYIHRDSPVHRLSAVIKLCGFVFFVLLSIPIRNLPLACLFMAASAGILLLSRLPLLRFLSRIRHVLFLLIIGLIFNLFFTAPQEAVTVFLRLLAIVIMAQTLTMSTPTDALIEGLERGFRMKREYVISILIAISFIPILESARKEITMAQSARGYDWAECGLRDKLRGFGALLIPLFRFSLKKAVILGEALQMKEQ